MSRDRAEEYEAGKALRARTPRAAHGEWTAPPGRPDPIATLQADDEGRLPNLVPIRYGRMATSPFAFLRGAASIMAHDLAGTPVSGILTQIGGDAHLSNFGAFGTPERRFVFDINDFDETLRGPWEFDLKRLAASVAVLGRHSKLRKSEIRVAALACARRYRESMIEYGAMHVLDVWYAHIDERELEVVVRAPNVRKPTGDRTTARPPVEFTRDASGAPHRIVDKGELLFHPEDADGFRDEIEKTLKAYRRTLTPERRELVERYDFVDAAYKVVGVGSVGTRCAVALLAAADDDVLVLQLKEARRSVHEAALGASPFSDSGERVVVGQRAMQSASDLFLGWARAKDGRTYYVRQLRDLKTQANVDGMDASEVERYAALCGHALARAHAKSGGDAARIAGYLGRGDAFDRALTAFAQAYADRNERDYAALEQAIRDGRVIAETP